MPGTRINAGFFFSRCLENFKFHRLEYSILYIKRKDKDTDNNPAKE